MAVGFEAVNEVADAKAARKRRQAFYTPLALVDRLVEVADVSEFTRVLEPSAGDGRIVHRLRQAGAVRIEACEIEAGLHERIRAAGGEVVGTDFLKHAPGQVYDRIVMNPPFKGKACDRHIEYAWTLLAPGGRLLSVAPPTVAQRMERCELKLPGCTDATVEHLGPDWFKDYGTGIDVILVELCRDLKGGPQPCEGFVNHATFNAAVTAASTRKLWERARGPEGIALGSDPKSPLREAIRQESGSYYGIDWAEVTEYLRPND